MGRMGSWGAALVVAVVVVGGVPAVAVGVEPERVTYRPPVPGPVVAPWRVPTSPYAAGNRGIDLVAEPGDPVRAAAGGRVAFAGQVGGHRHVVVLHPDGLRTTYAFVGEILVRRGDEVRQGTLVASAAGPVHFGVRDGDRYLDPATLLWGPGSVHLVPDRGPVPGSLNEERGGLVRSLTGLVRAGEEALSTAADWAAEGAGLAVGELAEILAEGAADLEATLASLATTGELAARYLRQPAELLVAMHALSRYRASQPGCTPADRAPPRSPARGRIAVLVAGFGSDGTDDAVTGVATAALGYDDADVVQFSYAGGQVDDGRLLAGVPATTYGPLDATGDLDVAADRLRELLADIRLHHPGIAVDLLAHSQGGLVARAALAGVAAHDPRFPAVANLVTIGAPHTGADLATAAMWVSSSEVGGLAVAAGSALGAPELASSPAVAQLAEGSDFLMRLVGAPLPAATRVTSIAGAGDLVVTANHSALEGAVNVLVGGAPGLDVHGGLPASPEVAREVALALAGERPTCRGLWGSMAQALAISTAADLVALSLGGAAHLSDRRVSDATARRR